MTSSTDRDLHAALGSATVGSVLRNRLLCHFRAQNSRNESRRQHQTAQGAGAGFMDRE